MWKTFFLLAIPACICTSITFTEEQCPNLYEVYNNCSYSCPPQTCDSIGRVYHCLLETSKSCVPKCVCEEGYYRNVNGDCVSQEDCEKCKNLHEYYSNCSYSCPPQTCDTIGEIFFCPRQTCRTGCVCENRYYRNAIDDCVSKEDCEKCPGPNEYFSCGGACDNVCATLNKQNQTSCPIINIKCNPMCYCAPGFARNNSNICIPIDECPPPLCPADETYVECPSNSCEPQTCDQLDYPVICDYSDNPICPGEPGCVCDYGNVRDSTGKCIPRDECQQCYNPHEFYSNCSYSCPPQTCDSIGLVYPCPFQSPENCVAECRCEEGYYSNAIGNCVSQEVCEKCPGPNEYFDCGGACDNVCATLNIQSQENCPIVNVKCNPMCYCAPGYARNSSNICVSIEQCSETCFKPNEVFSNCSYSCPPQTCEDIGGTFNCPLQTCDNCVAECRCQEGYYRNVIGNCVSQEDCEQCPGPNEYFDCNKACDNVCATLNIQNQTYCPYVNEQCSPMCYCAPGYARNSSNICIPIDECPAQCANDEIYDECPEISCNPLTCDQLGFPVNCELSDTVSCPGEPACVCDNDNVRDDTGQCISKDQCPSCGGDVNAKPGCGSHCGQTCANRGGAITACPEFCLQNGCDCKEGFLYDNNVGKCVLPCNGSS